MKKVGQYVYNVFLCASQVINCVILLGDPDVSISGRTGYAYYCKRPKWFVGPLRNMIDLFFLWTIGEVDHCKNSIEPTEKNEKELWKWWY